MFVGYADDNTGDIYRFIHLRTQHVILSRDMESLHEETTSNEPRFTSY